MNLFDFVNSQAKKAGVNGNAELTAILTANVDALKAIELPAVAVNLIGTNLMDMNQALNNPEIAGHFYGQLGGGIEKNLFAALTDFELDQADLDEIKSLNSTGKKVEKAIEKAKAKIEAIKKADPKGTSKELNDEIKRLNGEMQSLREMGLKSVEETASKYKAKLEKLWRKGNTNFEWNDAYDPALRETVYNAAIDSELSELGAKLVFNDETGTGEIFSSKNPELKVFDEKGKEVSFSDVHLRALQNKKLLVQTPGGGTPDPNRNIFTPPINIDRGSTQTIPDYVSRNMGRHERPIEANK